MEIYYCHAKIAKSPHPSPEASSQSFGLRARAAIAALKIPRFHNFCRVPDHTRAAHTTIAEINPWLALARSDFLHRLTKVIQQDRPNSAFVVASTGVLHFVPHF